MNGTDLDREVERGDVPDVLLDHELQQSGRSSCCGRSRRAGRRPSPGARRSSSRASGCARGRRRRSSSCCRWWSSRARDRRRTRSPSARRARRRGSRPRRKCSSCRPANSGLITSGPPGCARSNRNTGYSAPSISWVFSRPPLPGPQHLGLRLGQPVDLAEVDLVVGRVAAGVGVVGAQEAVGEPLGEEHEQSRWCRSTGSISSPPEQVDDVGLRRQRVDEPRVGRRQVAAAVGPVGQARPRRVVGREGQGTGAQGWRRRRAS